MSEEWSIAPPPFQPGEALQRLQRDLRGLGLVERAGQFERRGLAIAKAVVEGDRLAVGLVKRPGRSPEWQHRHLAHSGDVRDFLALVKKSLNAWSDRDD
jgi:hypothetical protein